MGKKERERKAKRALAPKAPVAKRPAAGSGNPASSVGDSGGVEAERELARVPPPNPATGSGNPASSVSSGGVEAEVRVVIPTGEGGAKWDYDEGKDGKYTCAQCGKKPLRSWFLIEAEDGEGNLRCEYDVEGCLKGRCYECCRCRGKYAGPKDIYDDLLATHSEEMLQNRFRRVCNKRHDKRSDVKKNEHAQLKIKEWKELLAKIVAKMPPGTSLNKCKRQCFDFCKKAAEDAHAAMQDADPELYKALQETARKFKEWKRIQAEEGDSRGIPCPHPERTGVEVQYLHKIFPNTNRFFICRNLYCSVDGSFFGYNTDWISTCASGGWKFACPHCGHPYSMGLRKKPGLLPANHIWHLEKDQSLMLAEWPDTVTEKAINESAAVMAEHATKQEFDKLTHDEVKIKIASAVSKTAVKVGEFRTMQLKQKVMSDIAFKNSTRGAKTHEYSWAHLANGYRGTFYKFVEGVTPVMKAADCMDYLSLLYCLMLHEDP